MTGDLPGNRVTEGRVLPRVPGDDARERHIVRGVCNCCIGNGCGKQSSPACVFSSVGCDSDVCLRVVLPLSFCALLSIALTRTSGFRARSLRRRGSSIGSLVVSHLRQTTVGASQWEVYVSRRLVDLNLSYDRFAKRCRIAQKSYHAMSEHGGETDRTGFGLT